MTIELLTSPHNFAVCKMKERNFPGVVLQGDSLFALYNLLQNTLSEMQMCCAGEPENPASIIPDLEFEIDKLKSVVESYEIACAKNGYELPYEKT